MCKLEHNQKKRPEKEPEKQGVGGKDNTDSKRATKSNTNSCKKNESGFLLKRELVK